MLLSVRAQEPDVLTAFVKCMPSFQKQLQPTTMLCPFLQHSCREGSSIADTTVAPQPFLASSFSCVTTNSTPCPPHHCFTPDIFLAGAVS
jgi:hypothetical protein